MLSVSSEIFPENKQHSNMNHIMKRDCTSYVAKTKTQMS